MPEMFHKAFALDSRTLIVVLFMGNLTAVIQILTYERIYLYNAQSKRLNIYVLARLLQALAFLLYILRGYVSDFASIIIGNVCMLTGSYFESVAIQQLANTANKRNTFVLRTMLSVSIIVFVLVEYLFHSPANRIIYSSIGVFSLIFISNIQLIISKKANAFKRIMGILYLIFLMFLLPSTIYTMATPQADIFTNAFLHSMTFLSMIALLLYGQSFYLLLAKEKADALLSKMATTDELSGLLNRSSFMEKSNKEFEDAREQHRNIAVFFCDIDHFKEINDVYGHLFGDEVIKKCSQVLQSCVRKNDIVCRYGGEEFTIFSFVSDLDIARSMAERIMTKICSIHYEDKPEFSFTVSIGVVYGIPQGDEVLTEYIERADQALYTAKNTGRNRYCVYSEMQAVMKGGRI